MTNINLSILKHEIQGRIIFTILLNAWGRKGKKDGIQKNVPHTLTLVQKYLPQYVVFI